MSEWRIRLKLHDGTVRAGRYIGQQDGHTYVMDPNTGEVLDYMENQIAHFDIKGPGGECI